MHLAVQYGEVMHPRAPVAATVDPWYMPRYPGCNTADWALGLPLDVWGRVGMQVQRQGRGVQSGAEHQDPCGHAEATVAAGESSLQAGRVACGTPFQLALEWDARQA